MGSLKESISGLKESMAGRGGGVEGRGRLPGRAGARVLDRPGGRWYTAPYKCHSIPVVIAGDAGWH